MRPSDPRNLSPFLQLIEQTAVICRRSDRGGHGGLVLDLTLNERTRNV